MTNLFSLFASHCIIKICGLSKSDTLEVAIEAGADMVGFVFYPKSPRHISLGQARLLGAQVRGRALKVALTVSASHDEILQIIAHLEPDILQCHGEETPEEIAQLKARFNLPVMKAIALSQPQDLEKARAYEGVADLLLFDAKPPPESLLPGGNGLAFEWAILEGYQSKLPWLLSGGLDAQNVARAILQTNAPGVDVSSGVERARGEKDPQLITNFIQIVRKVTSL